MLCNQSNYAKKYAQWRTSLLKSIQLQFFISFISLPFLIGWGLPISLLTPVSTLLFGPFLSCFLLISSLIFFLELLYIPNNLLIWGLEHVTNFWIACLNLEQRAWLIGFTKPPLFILCLLPLLALAIVHSKKITSIPYRIFFLTSLLIFTCITLKFFPYPQHSNNIVTIPCNKGAITLIQHDASLVMIDPGALASRPSYESFIAYTLIPNIIQTSGYLHIDHLVIFKLNKRILDALQFLASKVTIKNIYFPAWQGKIPLFAWHSYKQLKKIISDQKGTLIAISYKKKLYNNESYTLFIEPTTEKKVHYYDATYQSLCMYGTLNNQTISLS